MSHNNKESQHESSAILNKFCRSNQTKLSEISTDFGKMADLIESKDRQIAELTSQLIEKDKQIHTLTPSKPVRKKKT